MTNAVQYASNGCPLRSRSKKPGIYPPPVYVALFADGTEGRHSFYSPKGQALDFERGREGAKWLWRHPAENASSEGLRYSVSLPARTDLIGGHIECDSDVIADPHFAPIVPEVAKAKADPVVALIAKIKKLDWRALEAIQDAIDQRLAA